MNNYYKRVNKILEKACVAILILSINCEESDTLLAQQVLETLNGLGRSVRCIGNHSHKERRTV